MLGKGGAVGERRFGQASTGGSLGEKFRWAVAWIWRNADCPADELLSPSNFRRPVVYAHRRTCRTDRKRGSAFILAPTAEDVVKQFAAVDIDGGDAISVPWQPENPQMTATGKCFTACLASVKNSSLAFGLDFARPVANRAGGGVPAGVVAEIWLPDEVRVFVPGVWLTEVRDGDLLYIPCSICKKKMPEGAVSCPHGQCTGVPSAEKVVLTSVTLADSTGSLRNVLCRGDELAAFTSLRSVQGLETCLREEGHVSLPFRARCDVIIGSQKATQYETVTVANFELLAATPKLLEEWDTESRPAPLYVFQGTEAGNVGVTVAFYRVEIVTPGSRCEK